MVDRDVLLEKLAAIVAALHGLDSIVTQNEVLRNYAISRFTPSILENLPEEVFLYISGREYWITPVKPEKQWTLKTVREYVENLKSELGLE